MAQPYVGEIKIFGGNFAPSGWAFCNGQLMSISNNSTLFTLIGTTYGGDGVNTFGLPDLRGRVALHFGTSSQGTYVQGQTGGVENVTVLTTQMPAHIHTINAQSGEGNASTPVGNYFAASSSDQYATTSTGTTANMLNINGSTVPHNNLQPYLAVNYVISLFGVFPSRN